MKLINDEDYVRMQLKQGQDVTRYTYDDDLNITGRKTIYKDGQEFKYNKYEIVDGVEKLVDKGRYTDV